MVCAVLSVAGVADALALKRLATPPFTGRIIAIDKPALATDATERRSRLREALAI
jgi:hypothetical protein